jgi:hypothetical protein
MELSYLWYIILEHRVSIDPSEIRVGGSLKEIS